jgi:hypothetical protein
MPMLFSGIWVLDFGVSKHYVVSHDNLLGSRGNYTLSRVQHIRSEIDTVVCVIRCASSKRVFTRLSILIFIRFTEKTRLLTRINMRLLFIKSGACRFQPQSRLNSQASASRIQEEFITLFNRNKDKHRQPHVFIVSVRISTTFSVLLCGVPLTQVEQPFSALCGWRANCGQQAAI